MFSCEHFNGFYWDLVAFDGIYPYISSTKPFSNVKTPSICSAWFFTKFFGVDHQSRQETCQHNTYTNVFALGDCSSLPTSKTGWDCSMQCDLKSQFIPNSVLDIRNLLFVPIIYIVACLLLILFCSSISAEGVAVTR